MSRVVYWLCRVVFALVAPLPLTLVFRLGQGLGWLAHALFWPYRALARHNLALAFAGEKNPAQVRQLARQHFTTLGANLLSGVRASRMDLDELRRVATVENIEILQVALDRGRGVVLVLSHLGCWELFAQLCQFLPQYRWGTVYQPLGNAPLEEFLRGLRAARGVQLFNRRGGFHAPADFLRAGGALGVLVDQHAGDGGVWAPFFGRLASSSTLAALLALRTGAELVPIAVRTVGPARWRVVISPPVSPAGPATGAELTPERLTLAINAAVERQVRAAPADWFWVHNRWKTPRPRFLLATYKRGIVLEDDPAAALKPFRVVVRSPNWLGDAVMSIAAVQAVAAGRPDARVSVLCPAKLVDLWRLVPGVAEVLPIGAKDGLLGAARTLRRAGPFDAAVLLPNSARTALEAWLAGVPRRVGYPGHRRRWLLDQVLPELPPPGHGQARHHRDRYLEMAKQIGADITRPAAVPSPTGEAPGAASSVEENGDPRPRFALCPGAEYGPAKRWGVERFAATARAVAAGQPCRWVLLGTGKDRELGAILEAELGSDLCENLIGQTTLAGLIETLRGCRLLLSNDTGTMHLAAWLGVPTVAVFGSTEPRLTGPVAADPARVRVLRRQVECSPCFLRECPLDLRCMAAIRVEEVTATVQDLAG